ncbi:hypothetical protein EB796_007433 [Bugula neritina]|uniref:Uncharacterized protein n=1 Tax=Bugula neritina TaxID=10212 RepID=A0A7J7K8V0_BUGNE|nr:hypothetical protein EB796_007433 [Bugula neritina]
MRLEAVIKYGHKPGLLTHYAMIKDRVQDILEEEIPPFDVKDFYAEDSSSLTTLSVGNSSELSETNRESLASNDIADISQLLTDNSVECPEILYDPDNSSRIMIIGKNAGNIPAESRNRLNIVSRDVESLIHTVQMSNSSNFGSIERDADRSSNYFNSAERNCSPNIEDQLKSSKSCSWQRDFSDIGVQTSLGFSCEYLFPMQEPLAIFCAEHSHSWKQLECSDCYNHECNQCSIDFKKSHDELIAFMSDIRDKLLAKENLWMQAYKELIKKLAEFDVQNWKCIQELHLEVEMKNKMVKEKYAEMRQWRTTKYDRAIEDFAVNVVGEKLRAVSTFHELLKVRLENSSKADIIEAFAKLRVDAETALNEKLPEFKPTDFSTIETDSSSERIESRFTETESMSSDSIPDFSDLLEKHAIENAEISHDPDDSKTILILGKNAGSKLQEDLDALSKGTKFTLIARETQSSTHTTSMSNSFQIIKQTREANDWKGAEVASCELLLHAVCRNKKNNEDTKEMGILLDQHIWF